MPFALHLPLLGTFDCWFLVSYDLWIETLWHEQLGICYSVVILLFELINENIFFFLLIHQAQTPLTTFLESMWSKTVTQEAYTFDINAWRGVQYSIFFYPITEHLRQ